MLGCSDPSILNVSTTFMLLPSQVRRPGYLRSPSSCCDSSSSRSQGKILMGRKAVSAWENLYEMMTLNCQSGTYHWLVEEVCIAGGKNVVHKDCARTGQGGVNASPSVCVDAHNLFPSCPIVVPDMKKVSFFDQIRKSCHWSQLVLVGLDKNDMLCW